VLDSVCERLARDEVRRGLHGRRQAVDRSLDLDRQRCALREIAKCLGSSTAESNAGASIPASRGSDR
jgi:hypothetical protein